MDDPDKDVVAENIGAALRFGVLPDSALVARKLAQAQMFVVATPAYRARKGVPRTPTDLLKHDGIIFRHTGEDWVFRRGNSETHVRVPRRSTFSAADGVRAAVHRRAVAEGVFLSDGNGGAPVLPNRPVRIVFITGVDGGSGAPFTANSLNAAEVVFTTCGLTPGRTAALRAKVERNKVASVETSVDD